MTDLVVFRAGNVRCALPVPLVREILPAATLAPLPGAPAIVSGVLDVRGEVLPVVCLRRKLGEAARPMQLGDALIVAALPRLVLHADAVEGVSAAEDGVAAWSAGLARDPGGLLVIQDLAGFLRADELQAVHDLIAALAPPA